MLTLEQKYKALLVLGSWAYIMDHFIKSIEEPNFLMPEWLENHFNSPISSEVRIDLIEIAGYDPKWFIKANPALKMGREFISKKGTR